VSALLGLEKLDSPLGLGKIAAGGLPDATSVQIIHGIPPAATCPEVSHAYTKPGTYQAILTAIGLGGLSTENSFRLPVSGSVSTRFVPTEKRRYRSAQ
jgi:hypothetical protein